MLIRVSTAHIFSSNFSPGQVQSKAHRWAADGMHEGEANWTKTNESWWRYCRYLAVLTSRLGNQNTRGFQMCCVSFCKFLFPTWILHQRIMHPRPLHLEVNQFLVAGVRESNQQLPVAEMKQLEGYRWKSGDDSWHQLGTSCSHKSLYGPTIKTLTAEWFTKFDRFVPCMRIDFIWFHAQFLNFG